MPFSSAPIHQTTASGTLPQALPDAKAAKPMSVDAATQTSPEDLALYAGKRAPWANPPRSRPKALGDRMSEIQEIKTDPRIFQRVISLSKVTEEIIFECEQTRFDGNDLIKLISALEDVLLSLPDAGSQVGALALLIKVVKKLPAERFVAGVEMLMSSLDSIKSRYSTMKYAMEGKCYSRPLLDSFIMLLEMLETTHQNNKTLQAYAALVVVSKFNVIFDATLYPDAFECFSRASQMFAHEEINDALKENGFSNLLKVISWNNLCNDEGECIEDEERELPLIHLQRVSLDAIIYSMRDENLIKSLKEMRVEKFKDVYEHYGYKDE